MSLNFQDVVRPKRHDDGNHPGDFHDTPEAYYRQIYFEALDLIINCTEERFDQPGYRVFQSIELLLVKTCKKDCLESSNVTIWDAKNHFKSLSHGHLISQVKRLMQLLLVMPATNASSERSFSGLK